MAREHGPMTEPGLAGWKWRGADEWWSDKTSRGAGRLMAKLTTAQLRGQTKPAKRITFYFAYFNATKARRFYPIGDYGSQHGDFSLIQARAKAAELSAMYQGGLDLHAHFALERQAREQATRAQQEAARLAEARARSHTLRELLDSYTAHLERLGKPSAGDVKSIFRVHVLDPRQDLADRRAADIPMPEFREILAGLVQAGKGRTAGKLRSYLRAAYALAMTADSNPDAPLDMPNFGIEANPVAGIVALTKYNKARTRNLGAEEMHHFLKRLSALPPSAKVDGLILALLLGGQRPKQLLRVRPEDADTTAGTITLYDPKGKRTEPRPHTLPLSEAALIIVERRLSLRDKCPVIFTSDGERPLHAETISVVVKDLSAAMVKAKQAREPFQLRDIRRTCETMLAAMGVSKDLRAQLQSHGLGGVQDRHYDRHDYMDEKRLALERWQARLVQIETEQPGKSNVVPMRVARGRGGKGS